jgi:hypothetical protein
LFMRRSAMAQTLLYHQALKEKKVCIRTNRITGNNKHDSSVESCFEVWLSSVFD